MQNEESFGLKSTSLIALLIRAWRLGFDASNAQCNGEFPQELQEDGSDDVSGMIQSLAPGARDADVQTILANTQVQIQFAAK